jgi:NTE family protein
LSEGSFSQFVPVSARNTFYFTGGGGTVYNTAVSTIGLPVFPIGGQRIFAAYGTGEILTNNYGYGQLGYLRDLAQLPPFLGGKLYFVARLEGGAYQRADTPPYPYRHPADGVGGLIVNTIFGPVLIGGAIGDAGHHRFFFSLGRVF